MIFAQPIVYQSSQVAKVLIENVQRERHTTFLQETRDLVEKYPRESFSYLFVEEGTWQLDDHTLLEIGPVDTNLLTSDGWVDVNFRENFTDDLLVFSQVQTKKGGDFVHTRQRNTSLDGFQAAMKDEEAFNNFGHVNETVDWMAISERSDRWSQNSYLAEKGVINVASDWHTIKFDSNFVQEPILIASIPTYGGADFSGLPSTNLTDDGQVDIKIEADISKDLQNDNIEEPVNSLAIDGKTSLRESKEKKTDKNLLFKSGFEGNIRIVPFDTSKETISGRDSETNFSWDTDLPAERAYFFYLIGNESPESYTETRIERVVGPNGKFTNALYMEVKKDYQGDDFITRNEFLLFPSSDMKQGYISYSMKLQPNYRDAWPDKDAWRLFMEWKEPKVGNKGSTNNYRFNLSTRADRKKKVHWTAKTEQTQPSINAEWEADNKEVPVPIDEWFDIEVFWRQGDAKNGRLWLAVNGEEIFDFQGRTEHAKRPQDLEFWSIFKLYTGLNSLENGPVYQWIDDVEIRSDTPRGLD